MQIKIIARKFKFHNLVFYMLNKIIQRLDQSFFGVIGYAIIKSCVHPAYLLGFNVSIIPQENRIMYKKIFEKVWGNQNNAILRACKMIESCQNGKATA